VLSSVAGRQLVETENPSAWETVNWKCVLWLNMDKRDCNRSTNKIQSSELEPVIIVTSTTIHVTVYYASHAHIENIVHIHSIDMRNWNRRLLARSWSTEYLTFMQQVTVRQLRNANDKSHTKSKSFWQWYINTIIVFSDIVHSLVFLSPEVKTSLLDWDQVSRLLP
jgi:hypothetical protein